MVEVTNKSEFNEASLKMKRLHEIQCVINEAMFIKDYSRIFEGIGCLFREIYSKLSPDERKEIMQELSSLGSLLTNAYQTQSKINQGYRLEGVNHGTVKLSTGLFQLDCRLRELMDKYGFSDKGSEEGMF
jgi:hypothetical protein